MRARAKRVAPDVPARENVRGRRSRSGDRMAPTLSGRGGAPLSARGGGVRGRERVAGMQRSRLLAAAVGAIDELGYPNTTVTDITTRARVSRRTFYELFANRDECLAAVLGEAVGLVEEELAAAGLAGLSWRERVRGGLWVILSFLDREPVLARVCMVQALRGGLLVLERRERILARLVAVVDEGRGEGVRAAGCTALTAEGVLGAAHAIVHGRLLRGDPGPAHPLTGLLGELTAMIVLPYLGPAAARREQTRPIPTSLPTDSRGPDPRGSYGVSGGAVDPLEGVAMRLTYRTARVLEGIAEHPGASNREVSEHAGIHDQGQVSKLLARLERLGLLANSGPGHEKGEPNAWTLTPKGERVTQGIRMHISNHRKVA